MLECGSIGYYSGKEFENLQEEDVKSYCSSVADMEEVALLDLNHVQQPYDFFTSRKTKRFFREDFTNLTRAATNKEYLQREYKREID